MNAQHNNESDAHSCTDGTKQPHSSTPSIACELITAVQLAELLNVSERTLYRLKSSRRLPRSISLGGSVRWRLSDIRKWIADGCEPPATR